MFAFSGGLLHKRNLPSLLLCDISIYTDNGNQNRFEKKSLKKAVEHDLDLRLTLHKVN